MVTRRVTGDRISVRLRRWLGSTGAPTQWGLVLQLGIGFAAGAGLGLAVPRYEGWILSGLTGALVAGAAAQGPSRVARRLAVFTALAGLAATVAAFATDGHPAWSALTMAAVAMFTSLAASAGPFGAAVGFLGSLGYMLVAVLARLASLTSVVSLASATAHIAIGCAAGLLVALAGTGWRARAEPEAAKAAAMPALLRAVWTSLRRLDGHARDGVRRAIPLAVGMFLFQRTGGRDAFWIFLAAYIVLLPTGKTPAAVALARVMSTVVGVVLLAFASLVLPDPLLYACGAGVLLAGIAYGQRYPLVAGGLSAMGAVLFAGAPTGAVGHWALHRLLDTVVGAGLALAVTFLLWPRDAPDAAAMPRVPHRTDAPGPIEA